MKRNKLTAYIMSGLLACSVLSACQKDDPGFLSDELYYEQSPMVIAKGWEYRGIGINPDGSTRPMNFKLLHVYDKATGKNVDDIFMKKYPTQAWKAGFNALTDTTKDLILAKMFMTEAYPVNIEPASGQVYTNYTTKDLPSGHYTFDLEISNLKGAKVYPKFGEFILKDSSAFQTAAEIGGAISNSLMLRGDETKTKAGILPTVTITWEPAEISKLTVYFLDKNGTPFNPKKNEIVKRPSGDTYLQTFESYTAKPELFDDRMEFFVHQMPFPVVTAGNGFNIYYRIPATVINYDDVTKNNYHTNPRIIQRLQKRGNYTITVKFPDLTHK